MFHLVVCVLQEKQEKLSKLNIYAVCCCVRYGKFIAMLHCSVYFNQNTSMTSSEQTNGDHDKLKQVNHWKVVAI